MAYSATQLDYAAQIVHVGQQMGMTVNDQKTALMVALAESDLQNYANSKVAASLNIPHDAVGSDGNSVGIFQQQVGMWGDASSLMDVQNSARLFYNSLKNVPGRDTLSNAAAAQAVQKSAFADGSNYAAREADAAALLSQVSGQAVSTGGTGNPVSWFQQHGGWKRLGIYVLGGVLVIIALASMLAESKTVQEAVKVGADIAL